MTPSIHRRLATMVAAGLLLTGACQRRGPGAAEPTTSAESDAIDEALAAELARLDDPATRMHGLAQLELRAEGLTDDAERAAVAKAITPALVKVWDDDAPLRSRMLRLSLLVDHPGTSALWDRALPLDGSAASYEETLLALEGITKTRAIASVPALVAALHELVANPTFDQGEHAGAMRIAMIEALGTVGDRRALPALQAVLEQPVETQPVKVHRMAADALGRIGDPAATDALLTVMYRVPDAMTTTNIAERSKVALAAIGAPAVPRLVAMLEGRHEGVNELAKKHQLTQSMVTMGAAGFLGAVGSADAVEPLLRVLPQDSCRGRRRRPAERDGSEDLAYDEISMRALVANSLGLIGDERAVEPLCQCATASENPGDMFPIAEALGRIGGPQAAQCLARVIETGRFDPDTVGSKDFIHEIRWEAARFGLLAAGPEGLDRIEKAMTKAKAGSEMVARQMKPWTHGQEVLRRCGAEPDCLQTVLLDPNAHWFAREAAAVTLARQSKGDAMVAEKVARAFSVRHPDARVTMAWLSAHVMQGARCSACAERIAEVIEQERDRRTPMEYQLSVLTARYSIAKLREPTGLP